MSDVVVSTAQALFHADGKPSGIFYCTGCRVVFNDERAANACHGTTHCETCGAELGKRQPYYKRECDACDNRKWRERQAAEEFARYEKATCVNASDWTGDQVFFNDHYYETVEDAVDGCDQLPEYVWAAKNIGVRAATSEGIIEHVIEEMWEDADSSDLNGLDELDAAIAAFNEANKSIVVWMVDYSTAIVLDEKFRAGLIVLDENFHASLPGVRE